MRWDGRISLVILLKRRKKDHSRSTCSPSDSPKPGVRLGLYSSCNYKLNSNPLSLILQYNSSKNLVVEEEILLWKTCIINFFKLLL